jgi:hypothetical protein
MGRKAHQKAYIVMWSEYSQASLHAPPPPLFWGQFLLDEDLMGVSD